MIHFDIPKEIEKAVRCHHSGRLQEAEAIYKKIFEMHPDHPDALHLSGVVALQSGRYDVAVDRMRRAIQDSPGNPICHSNLGAAYNALNRSDEAIACYQKAVELKPDFAEAYHNLGAALKGQERFAEALSCFEKAVQIKPDSGETYRNMGDVLKHLGRSDEAISCYENAVRIKSDSAHAYYQMGLALKDQGRSEEAISYFQRAVKAKPDFADAYIHAGILLQEQGKTHEAILSYEKAIKIKPDYALAYNNLGNALQEQGDFYEAVSSYQRAVQLKPDDAKAYNNMGLAFQRQGKFGDAVSCYRKALELEPDIPETYNNMGDSLQYQERFDEAIACYERSLELSPDDAHAHSHLFAMLQQTCRWQEIEKEGATLDDLTDEALSKGMRTAEMPLASLMRHADPRRNVAVAKSWSDDIVRRMSNVGIQFSHKDRKSGSSKIRIGYLSYDFRSHPAAHLTVDLYGLHNRNEFDVFCYSYGENDGSYYRKRIEEECDRFVDIRDVNHGDAATRIYEDRIDILVDLTGHTQGGRLAIPALRPAPVQVSYLGFLGSTGADFLDYIITDTIVTPREHAPYYSEKFVYIPHCYQMNSNVEMEYPPCKREDFGLPEHGFIFCSFNEPYKIEPVMFHTWMKILLQVPESVLWLYGRNESVEKNLRREAEAKGVNPGRLIFAGKVSLDMHLARLKLADLALDTRIYNGGATTSHALNMGVPVITLQGGHFVSRMASSSLTAVGLSELIAHTLEEYEDLAVWLAESPKELQAIRRRLAKYQATKPLFNAPRFVKNLETAYKEMWKIFLAGENPRQIEVVETGDWRLETGNLKLEAGNLKLETGNLKLETRNSKLKLQTSNFKLQTSNSTLQTSNFYSLGTSLKNQGKLNEAVSCYRKALELNPKLAKAYISIANIIQGQGKSDEAISCYRKALELEPDSAIAFNNMGNVIKDQGNLDEAISCYQKALELNPDMDAACNNLLYLLQQTCDWKSLGALEAKLDDFTQKALDKGVKTAEDPFVNLMRHAAPYRNFRVAKSWSDHISGFVSNLKINFSHTRKSASPKITVGYLSNTFHNHPGAHLIVSLFGLHNRDEFQVFCYSYGKDDGSYHRKKIVQDCDKFVDILGMSHSEAATRIHKDQVDILVDLRGHTQGNTLAIPAFRPAPIQVSYLGFPGTTGADFFDYIITDKIVAPLDHAACYSENLVLMPHCYQVNNHAQAIAEKKWHRRDFGLPEHGFVFCSFNRGYKIEAVMFEAWMRILDRVPGSVLWLLPGNCIAEKHLRQEARVRGINARRLIFGKVLPKAEHLARHRLADLTLDTRIYNGHTTTSDSLWAGLPVITLQGTHFASRVSSSILTAVGLAELITHTLEEYESLAVHLANTPDELQAIQEKLSKNRLTEPLFDTPRFAMNLENAYKGIWKIFLSGEKPRQIEVVETGNWKLETGNWKLESRKSKLEIGNSVSEAAASFQLPVSSFKEAVRYHKAGKFREAQVIYRQILETEPNHADALHYLGVIAHQTGKNDMAEELIRKAIRIAPGDSQYHYNLGCVFQAQAKAGEAVSCFQEAINLKPDYVEAYNNMGAVFQNQDRLDEAISCFKKILEMKPDLSEAHNNMGLSLQRQDKLNEAISCFEKALQFKPDSVDAYNNMGAAFQRLNQSEKAISCFEKALQFNPGSADAYNNLGTVFRDQGKLNESVSYFQKALEIKPDLAEAYNNLGVVFRYQGNLEKAFSCFQKVLELKPDHANAYYNMGDVLAGESKVDEAIACCRKALQIKPDYPFAIAGEARALMMKGEFDAAYQSVHPLIQSGTKNIAVLGTYAQLASRFKEEREAIQQMKEILNGGSLTVVEDICQLHFNLGQLYNGINEYDTAFYHYQQGNALKTWRFNAGQHEHQISNMIAAYHPSQKIRLSRARNVSEMPVFIVGMPRSGTTLVEQIVSSHPQVFGAGELPDMGRIASALCVALSSGSLSPGYLEAITSDTLDEHANTYLERLQELSGHSSRVTNKTPMNFIYLGLIYQLFPKAAVIHCMRDSRDTSLSVYFQNFPGAHTYAFDLKNIRDYYTQYERLMGHWRDEFNIPMLEVRYEELVTDAESVSREMIEYLGLEWDERCLRFHESKRPVVTASYQQVREPVYTKSAGRWKNYEKYLQKL